MLSIQSMRPIPLFAVLGAASGIISIAIMDVSMGWLAKTPQAIEMAAFMVTPGLVFGLIIGFALFRRRQATILKYLVYVAVATVCYLATVTLTTDVLIRATNAEWKAGLVAGAFGSACLIVCTMAILPAARILRPAILTTTAGGLFGALLGSAIAGNTPFWMYVFFAAWHSGNAAGLALALRHR